MSMFRLLLLLVLVNEGLFYSDEVNKSSEVVSFEGLIMEPKVQGCS